MELQILNSATLAEIYMERNNEQTIEISLSNLNVKLSYLVQFTDSSKDWVFNEK